MNPAQEPPPDHTKAWPYERVRFFVAIFWMILLVALIAARFYERWIAVLIVIGAFILRSTIQPSPPTFERWSIFSLKNTPHRDGWTLLMEALVLIGLIGFCATGASAAKEGSPAKAFGILMLVAIGLRFLRIDSLFLRSLR